MKLVELLLIFSLCTIVQPTGKTFSVRAPSTYKIFTGNLRINVSTPSEGDDLTLLVTKNYKIWKRMTIHRSRYPYSLDFMCGAIDVPDLYTFSLVSDEGHVLASSITNATWPDVTLEASDVYILFKSKFKVTMVADIDANNGCGGKTSHNSYTLKYIHYPTKRDLINNVKGRIIHKTALGTLSLYDHPRASFSLGCHVIDTSGFYKVTLKSNTSNIIISSTRPIKADYRNLDLRLLPSEVFPCSGFISLAFTRSICDQAYKSDTIRMFRIPRTKFVNPTTDMKQVTEKRVDGNHKNKVSFECNLFNENHDLGYCFHYVSQSEVLRNVKVVEKLCIPSEKNSTLIRDGNWNSWGPWSQCSRTCGIGEQVRYRKCDNPKPAFTGKYCKGKNEQKQDCGNLCDKTTPNSFDGFTQDPSCKCGCQISSPNGVIRASPFCDKDKSRWILIADRSQVIRFTIYLSGGNNEDSGSLITVRDGIRPEDDLLLKLNTETHPHMKSEVVSSTGNTMLIEMELLQNQPKNTGFIAQYTMLKKNTTAPNDNNKNNNQVDDSQWKNAVAIVAISLCIVIIVIIIATAFHVRLRTKHKKEMRKNPLLVNGEIPTPSQSSASSAGATPATLSPVKTTTSQGVSAGGAGGVGCEVGKTGKKASSKVTGVKGAPQVGKHEEPVRGRAYHRKSNGMSPSGPCPIHNSPYQIQQDEFLHHFEKKIHSDKRHKKKDKRKHRSGTVNEIYIDTPELKKAVRPYVPSHLPPLALQEDLSPSTAVSPMGECIPMQDYHRKRPPAIGRDGSRTEDSDLQNANVSTDCSNVSTDGSSKPSVRPLPIRSVSRPDGQSPENRIEGDQNANTPNGISQLSPVLQKSKLFSSVPTTPGSRRTTPSADYEYDDYVPQVPDSYLEMNHGHYTLSWSKPPKWAKPPLSEGTSETSLPPINGPGETNA